MTRPDNTQEEFFFVPEATRRDLVLGTGSREKLRPSQTKFNQALKRLRKAQALLEAETTALERRRREFADKIAPAMADYNRALLGWIHAAIDRVQSPKHGLNARQFDQLMELIAIETDVLQDIRHGIEPDEFGKLETRLDEIFGRDDEDEEDIPGAGGEDDGGSHIFDEFMENFFADIGLDVDLSGIDPWDIEAMEERATQAMDEAGWPGAKPRKPSAKQIAAAEKREREARAKEQAKLRDFKSLFKGLAKAMHPDLVTEPEAKAHREDWMKRLTAAYEQRDLHAMLTIEMEWLGSESKDLAAATDEKLAIYSQLLREQALEVEGQLTDLAMANPFRMFSDGYSSRVVAPESIRGRLIEDTKQILLHTEQLRRTGKSSKQAVARMLRDRLDCGMPGSGLPF